MRALALRVFLLLSIPVRRRLVWFAMSTFTVGVSAIVLDDRGEILLIRHRFRETTNWELPGGFVERGESLHGALLREIREETGLDVSVERLASAVIPKPLHVDIRFVARVVGGTLSYDSKEVSEARLFAPADLAHVLEETLLHDVEDALAFLG